MRFSAISVGLLAVMTGCLGAAESARPRMRDFIGINGHTVQFKPELYRPVCRLVRDYHPVGWDLEKATSSPAPFPFAKNRVDWSKVYGSWQEHGWTTNACLMFESIERPDWDDLENDATAYGTAFAREFGPTGQRKLVESVEIGNKPGKLRVQEYRNGETPGRVIWAVWSPSGGKDTAKTTLTGVPGKLVASSRMPLAEKPVVPGDAKQPRPGAVELEVGPSPVYLILEEMH